MLMVQGHQTLTGLIVIFGGCLREAFTLPRPSLKRVSFHSYILKLMWKAQYVPLMKHYRNFKRET